MWRWNRKKVDDGTLRRIENEVFRALDVTESEADAAGTSPFFYRRLRAQLEAEARRRAEAGSLWTAWLLTARQATPALALVALLALGGFWSALSDNTNSGQNEATLSLLATGEVSQDDFAAALIGWERPDNNANSAAPDATPASNKE